MRKTLWIFTILGSMLGGLFLVGGLAGANGAPQQAAAAAVAVACAVLPYCLARAASELGGHSRDRSLPGQVSVEHAPQREPARA